MGFPTPASKEPWNGLADEFDDGLLARQTEQAAHGDVDFRLERLHVGFFERPPYTISKLHLCIRPCFAMSGKKEQPSFLAALHHNDD